MLNKIMKNLIKIITILIFSILWIIWVDAASIVNFWDAKWIEQITNNSISSISSSKDITKSLNDNWFKILTIIKTLISWILIIFIVYIWIQMILSMWSDEDKLTTSKTQLRYTLIALIFINIPWTLYNMFVTKKIAIDWNEKWEVDWNEKWAIDWSINWTWSWENAIWNESVFINIDTFTGTINWWIVLFIKAAIFSVAIFMIVLAGIKIMIAWWKEENIKEAKNKILRSLVWLIFLWFIESWQVLVYNWKISDWATIFYTIENLILFFAWPVAIFFLSLAWYYYITSNWDEEKTKKAKNIIINVIIASVILMASHLFLKDLSALTI